MEIGMKEILAEKRRMTPKSGFNVVGVDAYELPGRKLYLIAHHATKGEAYKALAVFQKKNPGEDAHVYGPDTK